MEKVDIQFWYTCYVFSFDTALRTGFLESGENFHGIIRYFLQFDSIGRNIDVTGFHIICSVFHTCMFLKVCSGFGCTDTQVKLEQEKHQREVAEERLLHVEKLRSDLVVDLAQEKKRNGLLEEELRAEAEKVSQLHT